MGAFDCGLGKCSCLGLRAATCAEVLYGNLSSCCDVLLLQDGRDFADVVSPKLSFVFDMASSNPYFERVIQHLVEGDTGGQVQQQSGVCIAHLILFLFLFVAGTRLLRLCKLSCLCRLAAARSGVNRYMIALIFRFLVAEKKLDVLQVRSTSI